MLDEGHELAGRAITPDDEPAAAHHYFASPRAERAREDQLLRALADVDEAACARKPRAEFRHVDVALGVGLHETKHRDVAIARKNIAICEPLGHRVNAVVNYEGIFIDREIEDAWAQSVSDIVSHFHSGVTRYTTGAFLRSKLGETLTRRELAPHVFESETEARAALPSSPTASR